MIKWNTRNSFVILYIAYIKMSQRGSQIILNPFENSRIEKPITIALRNKLRFKLIPVKEPVAIPEEFYPFWLWRKDGYFWKTLSKRAGYALMNVINCC